MTVERTRSSSNEGDNRRPYLSPAIEDVGSLEPVTLGSGTPKPAAGIC